MKKTFKYIFLLSALLAGFSGCVKEEFEIENRNTEDIPYPTEGKATVQFTVALPGNAFAATKATMADTPTIENMRIAVFGSSGFLKESVQIDEFEAAQYAIRKPLCIVCDDAELLDEALALYQGRALYAGSLPDEELTPMVRRYGLII